MPSARSVTEEGVSESGAVIAKIPARLAGAIEAGKTHDFFIQPAFINRFDRATGKRLAAESA